MPWALPLGCEPTRASSGTGPTPRAWRRSSTASRSPSCACERLQSTGRSVARIDDETVTAGRLAATAGPLVAIHGQHEQARLLDERWQRELLDAYGGHAAERAAMAAAVATWRENEAAIAGLADGPGRAGATTRARRARGRRDRGRPAPAGRDRRDPGPPGRRTARRGNRARFGGDPRSHRRGRGGRRRAREPASRRRAPQRRRRRSSASTRDSSLWLPALRASPPSSRTRPRRRVRARRAWTTTRRRSRRWGSGSPTSTLSNASTGSMRRGSSPVRIERLRRWTACAASTQSGPGGPPKGPACSRPSRMSPVRSEPGAGRPPLRSPWTWRPRPGRWAWAGLGWRSRSGDGRRAATSRRWSSTVTPWRST